MADGPAGFTQGYTCPALLRVAPGRDLSSRKGLSPAAAALSSAIPLDRTTAVMAALQPPPACKQADGFGLCPVRSPLLGVSLLFSLPAGTKMFQFPAFASMHSWMAALHAAGLPHSDIRGSQAACAYPRLFAACRVLHRLPEPRHPPCALFFFLAAPSPDRATARMPSGLRLVGTPTRASDARDFVFSLLCANMSKNGRETCDNQAPGGRTPFPDRGEYRIRTDGLLRAMQAL